MSQVQKYIIMYINYHTGMKGQVHCIVWCSFVIMVNGYSMHTNVII